MTSEALTLHVMKTQKLSEEWFFHKLFEEFCNNVYCVLLDA